jgi:two-component system C4-dicarboxylate transport sensor histidine kinase DctB
MAKTHKNRLCEGSRGFVVSLFSGRLQASARHVLRPTYLVAVAAVALAPVLLWSIWLWSQHYFLQRLADQTQQTLSLYAANVQGTLERYQVLPALLARNQAITRLLLDPDNPALVEETNRTLEEINARTGAADTYLMAASGLTLAASNWQSERPFVGGNFSYRPYFQEAMRGQLGRYHALGTTSNKRGYYFASPVREGERIIGAVVVKVDVRRLESAWGRSPQEEVLVVDSNGVIFITSNADWLYNATRPLSDDDLARIRNTRQYSDATVEPFPFLSRESFDTYALVSIQIRNPDRSADATSTRLAEYLDQWSEIPAAGWTAHILADTREARAQATATVALAGFALLVILLSAASLMQRRRNLRARIATQEQAQARLEQEVALRTSELVSSNEQLRQEIADRRRAESELRHAQDELVQASKLAALGEMSAGISHELNQPLAAIRTYAENGCTLIARARQEEVAENLRAIADLAGRMGRIIKNLKTFARRDETRIEPVQLAPIVRDALDLLHARLSQEGIRVIAAPVEGDVYVMGGKVRLQQVLVNLMANAIDALRRREDPTLEIAVDVQLDEIRIAVRDNGPGVPEDDLARLFDPFFTTKETGEGLGLGLSISYGIIRQFGGEIRAENRVDGGAEFTLQLRRAGAWGRAAAE